jgi:polyphosphate kinase
MKSFSSSHFINRELSWMEFNQRVLDEALDPSNPLLERLKFFCITSSNLDEFFEVRVAGIKQQIESDVVERSVDGLTATETFRAVTQRVRRMVDQQDTLWRDELAPGLAAHGISFLNVTQLNRPLLKWLEEYYRAEVHPVITPLGIDPAHPFPQLLNKTLHMIVQLEIPQAKQKRLAILEVPRVLPPFVSIPSKDSSRNHIFLGHIIGHFLKDLFTGAKILGSWLFRVTRNSELYIDEGDVANLLKAVENELHNRRRGDAVRLEVEPDCPLDIRAQLLEKLRLTEDDLYVIHGPLNPIRLMTLYEGDHSPELRDPPFVPETAPILRGQSDLFALIRERDLLLHHPYESFSGTIQFLEQAATDPNVLAIKQTLYRSGGDPRVIGALMRAVRNGKQVTAVIELKARFDEAKNIEWSLKLEEAGVHVVYGLVGYKIHAKICLIVRRDPDCIRRYVHLSTGNYNPTTARVYTDLSLLTAKTDFGEDATNLFNLLTGICQFQPPKKFLIAPFELKQKTLGLIQREAENAAQGLPARIIAKMNALVDQDIIEALYRASLAGVKIDLIVRGICCLRPQVPHLSQNITVRSIVDRFLEHSRIFYFENGCNPEIFLASSDWMPRNFYRRIEVMFPITDGNLHERIRTILESALADNVKARILQSDDSYKRPSVKRGAPFHRHQSDLIASSAGKSAKSPGAQPSWPKMRVAPHPLK